MKPAALSFVLILAVSSLPVRPSAQTQPNTPASTKPAVKTPQPWPSAKAIAARKQEADNRKLFAETEPLAFTLISDFKAIDRDRDPESTKLYPATIVLPQPDGTTVSKEIQIRGRGHSRRNPKTCDFVPLRLEFAKGSMSDTVLAGHSALKLGTHCRSAAVFEQYVLREYTAYRLFNLVTPRSFRVRLAKATYVDATNQKPIATRFAMFTEDDDDVAKRMEGRSVERPRLLFRHVDLDYTTLVMVFEFMIGNTDLSIFALHNIRVVETQDGKLYPVPYDLDYSGLVNTQYAAVAPILDIASVRERLYRGPCRPVDEFKPYFETMKTHKAAMYALYDELPLFTDTSRKEAKAYLDEFFKLIEKPNDVKRHFLDTCVKGGPERQVGM